MQTAAIFLGGGVIMTVWQYLPTVIKAAIILGLIGVSAIEMNKAYWESFYSSAVHSGAAAEGDSKTANLKAAQRDLAENNRWPVPLLPLR